ncbi:MAG TPA: carbon monoxide dehydrogenase, partial [Candidatus Wallbacteria bacterium]|nr:carbon monoxide dehydrogenase [Candidatus Wallbacteria bacterium]
MSEVKNEFIVNNEELRKKLTEVGKNKRKVDGDKIARGRAQYVDDIKIPVDKLYHAKIMHSPHAHAIIKKIDASKALKLPGVVGVFSHENVPRVPYTTAGQNYPEPSPYDTVMFDSKVRYVGDRVCAVLADSPETAAHALELIKVEYEVLPAVLDMREAIGNKAIIHDERDATGIFDKDKNIAAHVKAS